MAVQDARYIGLMLLEESKLSMEDFELRLTSSVAILTNCTLGSSHFFGGAIQNFFL